MPPTSLTGPGGGPASVGFTLSQLGSVTARTFADLVGTIGLEPRHFAVLRASGQHAGDSQHAIAARLGIPSSTMVSIVDALEARGLLSRLPNDADRRAHVLRLTEDGEAALGRATELGMRRELEICAGMSDDDRSTLLALLARVASNLGVGPGTLPDRGSGA